SGGGLTTGLTILSMVPLSGADIWCQYTYHPGAQMNGARRRTWSEEVHHLSVGLDPCSVVDQNQS
ncbi:MAG: hypothetical protein ABW098_18940, partial [Candidatus Thiodiazotropha sp.]